MTPADIIVRDLICVISEEFQQEQLAKIKTNLSNILGDYEILEKKNLPSTDVVNNEKILNYFLACKKIAGCSDKTINCYRYHLRYFAKNTGIYYLEVNSTQIRKYLAILLSHSSNSYVDDARRILNSFYSFLEIEDLIKKNPVKK